MRYTRESARRTSARYKRRFVARRRASARAIASHTSVPLQNALYNKDLHRNACTKLKTGQAGRRLRVEPLQPPYAMSRATRSASTARP
ncbi:hypothetical protein EVAR_44018_1 [Eumeta japonica]|uniref:Uncharacterized protein n=1 Tax=Eumeta variegata TaxID=151549 RepID=A0A4C1XH66_EUMVA|nr:hypothetical protein EVAR_44018_1 [Eumeta japonica]